MKNFSSLFIKILFCFIVNLILVVVVLAGCIVLHGRVDMHALLGRGDSDRLRIAAMLIIDDLKQSPDLLWSEVLTRHKDVYNVDFALVLSADSIFVSEDLKLPAEVINQAAAAMAVIDNYASRRNPRNHHRPGPWYGSGKYHDRTKPRRLTIRTQNPTRYWMGIKVPAPASDGGDMVPAMLLAGSDSITANGFFFNPFPWIVVVSIIICISALLWVPMVRHITKPIGRLTKAAEKIANGKFDINIYERRHDEIGRLSGAINHMTSRLRGVVEGQKRFLRDVAHELSAPIARIQLGVGILEQRMDKKDLESLADVAEDVAQLSELVNELLSFSRAEATPEKIKPAPLELLPIVQRVASREGVTAVKISIDIDPAVRVVADSALLARAVANVLRNAVKYGGQSGPVTIAAKKEKKWVTLEIRDAGPGVPEKLIDKIFEPFFRPQDSRSRESGGVGLGLSIVKTCMDGCGGTVTAENLKPRGFAVALMLACPD